MRTITLALALLLAACGGGPESSALPSSAPPTERVVFIGDSVTQFWGGGPPAYASPALCDYVPGSVNMGISGQTTKQMLARFDDVLAYHPTVVVILGGTNDIAFDEALSTDSIAEMARRASAAGARVVIGTVPPSHLESVATAFHGRAENDRRIAQFDADLRMLATAMGYVLVDYHAALVRADGQQDSSLFQPDEMHPDAAGYAAMWKALKPAM